MFCNKCGKEILNEAVICPGCGCAVDGNSVRTPQKPTVSVSHTPLQVLADKIMTEAIVYMVVASIQAILGFIILFCVDIASGNLLIVVSIYNFLTASKNMKSSKAVLDSPDDIIEKYLPIEGFIMSFAVNMFLGGIIGVVGTAFGFVTRNYIIENRSALQEPKKSERVIQEQNI